MATTGNFWLVYHDLLESDEEVALDWSAPLHCPYHSKTPVLLIFKSLYSLLT